VRTRGGRHIGKTIGAVELGRCVPNYCGSASNRMYCELSPAEASAATLRKPISTGGFPPSGTSDYVPILLSPSLSAPSANSDITIGDDRAREPRHYSGERSIPE